MFWILGAGAVLLVALGGYWYKRSRPAKEEPVYYYVCPGCKRKLKYRSRQMGHSGMCPRCKRPFTFPMVAEKK
jgi:hypothetical protein